MRSWSLVLAVLVLAAGAFAAEGPVGRYELQFSGQPGWQRHELVVEAEDARQVRGRLVLDRGIGPQDRMPNPDERIHRVPFQGRRDGDGTVRFEVRFGEVLPVRQSYELYRVRDRWVGVMTESSGAGRSRRRGVLATPRP